MNGKNLWIFVFLRHAVVDIVRDAIASCTCSLGVGNGNRLPIDDGSGLLVMIITASQRFQDQDSLENLAS